jgi:putative tricarboxylic transport membrane protein
LAREVDRTGAGPPDEGTERPVEDGVEPERSQNGDDDLAPVAAGEVEVIERHKTNADLGRELLPEIGILAVAVYLFYLAGTFEFQQEEGQLGPGFWPRMAATGLIAAVLVRMVQTVRERDRPIVHVTSEFDEYAEVEYPLSWSRLAIALVLAVGYVIATMFLGYLFSTAIFLFLFIWIGGQRKWYVPLVAVGGALVFTYIFIGVVYVSLPSGVGIFDTLTVAIYNLLGIQ